MGKNIENNIMTKEILLIALISLVLFSGCTQNKLIVPSQEEMRNQIRMELIGLPESAELTAKYDDDEFPVKLLIQNNTGTQICIDRITQLHDGAYFFVKVKNSEFKNSVTNINFCIEGKETKELSFILMASDTTEYDVAEKGVLGIITELKVDYSYEGGQGERWGKDKGIPILINLYPNLLYYYGKGMKFQYPRKWEKFSEDAIKYGVGFSISEDASITLEAINFSETEIVYPNYTDLDGYKEWTNQQLENSFNLIESTETTLAGNPAHKFIYEGFLGKEGMEYAWKWMQTATIKNNTAYLITYQTTPEKYYTYLGEVQKLIDTFQIT